MVPDGITSNRQLLAGRVAEPLAFLAIVGISLAMPSLPWPLQAKAGVGLVLLVPTGLLFLVNTRLFVASLFFAINSLLSPFALVALERLPFQIPQLYFLPSIILYLILLQAVPSLRRQIGWLQRGEPNRPTAILCAVIVVGSIFALVGWAFFIADDLSRFRKFIPELPLIALGIYGVVFAVTNAFIEEFIARAVLFDGFTALTQSIGFVIVAQALIFSTWHFNGFPGGFIGSGMVFVWSLFLGLIRHFSGGMLAPLITHFFADLAIVIIILYVLVLPTGTA